MKRNSSIQLQLPQDQTWLSMTKNGAVKSNIGMARSWIQTWEEKIKEIAD